MRVQMIYGVLGTDGETWDPDTIHEAGDAFGRWLIARKKARPAPALSRAVPVTEPGPACGTEDEPVAGPEVTSAPVEGSPPRRPRRGRR